MTWLWVLIFGATGVGARFAIDSFAGSWASKWSISFPIATFVINILGCLIAGYIFGSVGGQKELAADSLRLAIVVGFCGGFTTFSGFGLQFWQLANDGKLSLAFTYAIATPIVCVFSTGAGLLLSK